MAKKTNLKKLKWQYELGTDGDSLSNKIDKNTENVISFAEELVKTDVQDGEITEQKLDQGIKDIHNKHGDYDKLHTNHTQRIDSNKNNITTNKADIATNHNNITTNKADIATNKAAIANLPSGGGGGGLKSYVTDDSGTTNVTKVYRVFDTTRDYFGPADKITILVMNLNSRGRMDGYITYQVVDSNNVNIIDKYNYNEPINLYRSGGSDKLYFKTITATDKNQKVVVYSDVTLSVTKWTGGTGAALTVLRDFTTVGGVGPNTVGTTELKNGSVTESKIGVEAVTSTKIANSVIDFFKLQDRAVGNEKISLNTILNENIRAKTIDFNKIADEGIRRVNIKSKAIGAAQIQDGTIANYLLARDAVTTDKIKDKAVTLDKIADGVIPSGSGGVAKFKDNSTETSDVDIRLNGSTLDIEQAANFKQAIWSDADMDGRDVNRVVTVKGLQENKLIVNASIANNSIDTDQIINKSITADKIADGVLTAGGSFNKGAYFTKNSELLTKNDNSFQGASTYDAEIGSGFKGNQVYGNNSIGGMSFGSNTQGNINIGYNARDLIYIGNDASGGVSIADGASALVIGKTTGSINRLYAGNGSSDFVEFKDIVDEVKHLTSHKTQQRELLALAVYDQVNNRWTALDNNLEVIDNVQNVTVGNNKQQNEININFKDNIKPGKYYWEMKLQTDNTDNMVFSLQDIKTSWNYSRLLANSHRNEHNANDESGYFLKDVDLQYSFRLKCDLYYNGSNLEFGFTGRRFPNHSVSGNTLDFYKFEGTSYGTKAITNNNGNNLILGTQLSMVIGNPTNRKVGLRSGSFLYLYREVSD